MLQANGGSQYLHSSWDGADRLSMKSNDLIADVEETIRAVSPVLVMPSGQKRHFAMLKKKTKQQMGVADVVTARMVSCLLSEVCSLLNLEVVDKLRIPTVYTPHAKAVVARPRPTPTCTHRHLYLLLHPHLQQGNLTYAKILSHIKCDLHLKELGAKVDKTRRTAKGDLLLVLDEATSEHTARLSVAFRTVLGEQYVGLERNWNSSSLLMQRTPNSRTMQTHKKAR